MRDELAEQPEPPVNGAEERTPVPTLADATDGVREVRLDHWRKFVELVVGKDMLRPGLIWRGQRRGDLPDWALLPRLDRELPAPERPPEAEADPWYDHEKRVKAELIQRYSEQLARFKIAAAGRRGINPRNLNGTGGEDDENDDWWALGQHYGLHTPLLDWTESPFAALYFAFVKDGDESKKANSDKKSDSDKQPRCVFALDRTIIDRWNQSHRRQREGWSRHTSVDLEDPAAVARAQKEQRRQRAENLDFPRIRIIRPTTDENLRLLSQGGVFTKAPPGQDVESFIRTTYKGNRFRPEYGESNSTELEAPVMYKILIREDDRSECLIALNRMAINHRNLFPDLEGAGIFVNMSIKYPGY